ncbi:MAG: hypothetical protein CVV17_06830 [Gammaproteobacteria bacterium HGW-Gammaproteobacteria-7]|nr:MAG: hypothetical protein CVV17_06830 [Gammaproteobacteria bacterium HGW-Gammaproteobacteria-7]
MQLLPTLATTLLILTLAAQGTASAQQSAEPAFNAGSHYTAVFSQHNGRWRLLPADGQDFEVDTLTCPASAPIPTGIWLLTRDTEGRPELLAPSSTALPAGSPDRIALRPCDAAGDGDALAAPQALIDLLAANTGAIYVEH